MYSSLVLELHSSLDKLSPKTSGTPWQCLLDLGDNLAVQLVRDDELYYMITSALKVKIFKGSLIHLLLIYIMHTIVQNNHDIAVIL